MLGFLTKFFGGTVIKTIVPQAGFQPSMVKRPLVGEGNIPQYFYDAFQVGFNAVNGSGVLPRTQFTAHPNAPLDIQAHVIGPLTSSGGVLIQSASNSSPLMDKRQLADILK